MTSLCSLLCYATRGHFLQSNVKRRYRENFERSLDGDFGFQMGRELRGLGRALVRIHVSGDFYSTKYVQDWLDIVRACPQIRFFAYTRSWNQARLLPGLLDLAACSNMQLWFSADRVSGRPPEHTQVRYAWLANGPEDEASTPRWSHLVFRNKPRTVLKRTNDVLVCPVEQGTDIDLTCTTCQICFADSTTRGGVRRKPPEPQPVAAFWSHSSAVRMRLATKESRHAQSL
jgi:hypothetical protein